MKEKSSITPKRMVHEGFTIFPFFSFYFLGGKVLPTRPSNPSLQHSRQCHHATLLPTNGRQWGGALRDDTNNGCVADYSNPDPDCLRKKTIYQEADSFRFAYRSSVFFFSTNIVELDFLVKDLKHGGSTRGFESHLGLKFSVSSYV